MSSFAFVPRSVKKKQAVTEKPLNTGSTSSLAGDSRATSEVSPKAPLISASALARVASERVGPSGNDKGKSKQQERIGDNAQDAQDQVTVKPAPKPAQQPDLEDLAALVCLALSDYRLWADVDLRRKIDWSTIAQNNENEDEQEDNDDKSLGDRGYISLDYLFRHSPIFKQASSSQASAQQPETTYVKALRMHAAELLDVRLVLSSDYPSYDRQGTAQWGNKTSAPTGYEVRRKVPAQTLQQNELSGHGKVDWDKLTLYLENIPVQYRSFTSTLKFVADLLPQPTQSTSPILRIQNISFPSHHRDQPGSLPACKGFALVTLSSLEDVRYLLAAWPWDLPTAPRPSRIDEDMSVEIDPSTSYGGSESKRAEVQRDAQKFGLRALSKERWDELKAEYLLYRQQLVDEINDFQEEAPRKRMKTKPDYAQQAYTSSSADFAQQPAKMNRADPTPSHVPSSDVPAEEIDEVSQIHAGSPYPSGCLVFVRNAHPDTNKTTLRTLFSQAWKQDGAAEPSNKPVAADGLDYIDYMKGMDNCHIRLSTPSHSKQLLAYFSSHPTVQTSGLDATGKEAESTTKAVVTMELVLGKREQVYWEKVPEKVRRQAVNKAVQVMHGGGLSKDVDQSGRGGGGKQKKRKKGNN